MNKQELVKQIVELKEQGLGSRKIAKELGISKSSVNSYYKQYLENNYFEVNKPKILVLDIETACSITGTFGRRKQNISQDAVIREGGWIISYAYKWLGEGSAKGSVLTPEEAVNCSDVRLCAELHELLEQSDIVLAHNGSNFDIPMIKARMIINDFPPIRKVKVLDSLTISREFRFPSQKLDSLGSILNEGRKLDHAGISLWIKCQEGCEHSLNTMQMYNRQDVDLLENVYLRLRNHSTRHPNLAATFGDKPRCNICLSDNVTFTGNTVTTNLSEFPEVICNDCGARSKTRKSLTTKEQRKNFLSN